MAAIEISRTLLAKALSGDVDKKDRHNCQHQSSYDVGTHLSSNSPLHGRSAHGKSPFTRLFYPAFLGSIQFDAPMFVPNPPGVKGCIDSVDSWDL
jgi:hypothetical protein